MNMADTDSSEYSDDEDEDVDSDDTGDRARLIVSEIERALRGKHDILKNVRDEADKNADTLVADEEKTKRKAEKRKAYKKKRKEKKKQEKEQAGANKGDSKLASPKSGGYKNRRSEDSDANSEEELDPTSAFVANVAGKISEPSTGFNKEKSQGKEKQQKDEEYSTGMGMETRILQSRQLAIRGNELASMGNFEEAVIKFTKAIELDPTDYRFFGNRSYGFDRQGYYDRALKDAEKAIRMAPSWPKGFFRKGRALFGLNKYTDAEEAFQQVLKLDKNCQEAIDEIFNIRTEQIIELGFTREEAEQALKKYACVQTAVDALLAGTVNDASLDDEDEIYVSDDEMEVTEIPPNSRISSNTQGHNVSQSSQVSSSSSHVKMDPNNPEGRKSLWVGNVQQSVSDRQLHQLFAKHGHVVSVKRFPDKYCAFVNYADKESAGRAMKLVQGVELANYKLLIKYPDNPKDEEGTIILKKTKTVNSTKLPPPTVKPSTALSAAAAAAAAAAAVKLHGPVNGNECYFWRTTGCKHSDKCLYSHIPTSRGIDKKPWMKTN